VGGLRPRSVVIVEAIFDLEIDFGSVRKELTSVLK
jgi:hypothetical protein